MKRKHRGYADLFRKLITPVGALALGVAVFAASVSSADNKIAEIVEDAAPVAIDPATLGPQSATAPPDGGNLKATPLDRSTPDADLPVGIVSTRSGGVSTVHSGGGAARGGGVGDACTCDQDCAALNDINNCKVGICDADNMCDQVNALEGTWCDLDGLFCTFDTCNGNGFCLQEQTSAGTPRTPCENVCAGGSRPGLFCTQDSDCPGAGATCGLPSNGVCNETDDRCENDLDLGRCCSADGTSCNFVTEGSCASGLWYRVEDPSDLAESCICPKYSSGISPEGVDGVAVGPIMQSNKRCSIAATLDEAIVCEGDGFGFCPRRCSPDSDAPNTICSRNVECALTGQCDDGSNDPCIPDLDGADCVGGGNCIPDNGSATCDFDTCDIDSNACDTTGTFLNIGDDYSTANGSPLRLSRFIFRGGVEAPQTSLIFEIYDDSTPPSFVTALIFTPPTLGIRTWDLLFDCYPNCDAFQDEQPRQEPIIIPGSGHIMMRTSRAAGANAHAFWMSTTSPPDVGTNDPDGMWVNDTPGVDHLGAGNNTLEFELIGEKEDILGACCDPEGIDPCADTPEWLCRVCADGTDCTRGRDCGTEQFCLPTNWKGPESHEDFVFNETKLCASDVCTAGACCNADTGGCEEVDPGDCVAANENFLGLGTSCVPNCCQQPVDVGGDCACDTFQCSTDGGTTFTGEDCTVDPLVCNAGAGETCEMVCAGPTPHQLVMPYQCQDPVFGGPLDPPVECTFGDDAFCNGIEAGSTCDLEFYFFSKEITFTGDSSGASVGLLDGDTCSLDINDKGWYEAFELTECGVVTIDHCCDPGNTGVKSPVWIVMNDGCPCGANGGQTVSPDINELGSRNGFGPGCNAERCCEQGNWAGTFTLGAGTYTWQISGGGVCGSSTTECDSDDDCFGQPCNETLGPYFGHVTYERCPLAACCNGETCSITDKLDCEDNGGFWLGEGDNPVVDCLPGVNNVCLLGTCCTGPGECNESAQFDTLAECIAADPDNVYTGGATCDDEPCPVCDFRTDGNCKFDDGRFILPSDRALVGNIIEPTGCPAFLRRAEDFRPASNQITNICWWPSYFNPFTGTECAEFPPPDDFHVRFFEDDGGLPGLELGPAGGQPLVPDAKQWRGGNSRVWEMTATLGTPIAVTPGDCYWIEITGKGDFDGSSGCVTYVLESLEGNGYGLSDGDGVYGPEDVNFFDDNPDNALADAADIAYCISSGLASNDDCQTAPACCFCDGTGSNLEPLDCKAAGGFVLSGELDPAACAAFNSLANDDCSTATELTAGLCGGDLSSCSVGFDNRCATNDGPLESCDTHVVGIPGAGDEFVKDLWYKYVAPGSGEMIVSTCDGTNYDSMLAVYEGGPNCDAGACPTGGVCGTGLGEDNSCVCDDNNGDPGCEESCFATSDLSINVQAGQCYFIRVGGDRGSEVQMSGSGVVSIEVAIAAVQPPTLAPPPHDIRKNRYISIDAVGPNPGLSAFDIKATMTASQVSGITGIGQEMWAGDPDAACVSIMTQTRPATAPDWSLCPVIHLTSCGIVPTTSYDIIVVDGAAESAALSASTQDKPGPKWWGDIVGQFDAGTQEWTPPNLNTNIDDAVACIKTFQDPNAFNATHISVSDLQPHGDPGTPFGTVNKIVNIGDCFGIILGFQGNEFPGFDVASCP